MCKDTSSLTLMELFLLYVEQHKIMAQIRTNPAYNIIIFALLVNLD